jgi:hypothetical protein
MADPAGIELAIALAASVIAATGPMARWTPPALSIFRCSSANTRNDQASAAAASRTQPQRRRRSALP